jgi:transposase
MMTSDRDKLSKAVARTIAIIQEAVPDLTSARDLLDRFHRINQHRKDESLEQWIEDAKHGLMRSFVSGIIQDRTAVKVALMNRGRMARPRGKTRN